jgi:hypothetical protein
LYRCVLSTCCMRLITLSSVNLALTLMLYTIQVLAYTLSSSVQQTRVLVEQRVANKHKSGDTAPPSLGARVQGLACDLLNLTPADLDDILSVTESEDGRSQVCTNTIAVFVLATLAQIVNYCRYYCSRVT